MDRRNFLKAAAATGTSFTLAGSNSIFGASSESQKVQSLKQKPNVIFIMADDLGYETIGHNKATNYKTPNVDKLANESFVFTNCDAQPLCCPTRIKLVSGQYNYRNYTGWGSFDLECPAIGKMMQQAGYATAVFGKWHMYKTPEKIGFDEHCIFTANEDGLTHADHIKYYYYDCPVIEDGKRITVDYAPDKFNQRVLKFIDEHKEKPFFIYYPFSLGHNPFVPTPDSKDKTSTNWQNNFEDMVAYIDKMIGNVVAKLKAEGLYDNTVIFFTSDNGTMPSVAHEMVDGEVIYGGKGSQAFDGCHVPLLVKYNGVHKTCDDLVDFSDFYPTLVSIGGVKKEDQPERMDGVSFLPLLENKIRDDKPYIFSVYFHPLSAYIRGKQYKLHLDGRLYDIVNDPRELKPFYSRNDTRETAKAREKLKSQLTEFLENERYSKYKTKQQLIDKFGDHKSDRTNNWMLGGFIFDKFGITPEQKTISCNITKFLDKDKNNYSLRFARAGLNKADAVIKSVKVIQNGKTVFSENYKNVELTTRRDVDRLRKMGNPYISFKYKGDGTKVPIGELSRLETGNTELVVNVEVSNPDNQWGDRIMLHLFLDRE